MKSSLRTSLIFLLYIVLNPSLHADVLPYVQPMMGTAGEGRVVPIAAVPFGMVQLGPDTHFYASGYHYSHNTLQGFSHTHKSGGGGADFLDINFLPLAGSQWNHVQSWPTQVIDHFSHQQEEATPGYYQVTLSDSHIHAELTATERCGMHRYTYPQGQPQYVAIDLLKGHVTGCTIYPEDDYDTVRTAFIEQVDEYTLQGYRISDGWVPSQHVFFYAKFSCPIQECRIYSDNQYQPAKRQAEGRNIRMLVRFQNAESQTIVAKVGISPVSIQGARKNLHKEVNKAGFDYIREQAQKKWEKALGQIQIDDPKLQQKQVFYSTLYFSLLYPQLYSDVDGRYRSSDSKVYRSSHRYFAGVLGLWDTFRAQNPLITLLHPDVTRDLMHTFQYHFDHCGQLPVWTLAGRENMCMIGYHSMPVIADAYAKGIRGFDAERLFKAMKVSAERDTFGYFVHDFRGATNYRRYHYVPCDMEINAVSKTLEYCYDDWCIAQMARMLKHTDDYQYFTERSCWWKNLFDKSTMFMRGRMTDGSWRTPFDPFMSNHYHKGDDFCEGTSWQWTFFVPHDGQGLIQAFGSKDLFVSKLDSLFNGKSDVHGDHPASDITGFVGQYAHGNEPGHHTIYMYDYAGVPWKGQRLLSDVCYNLYNTSETGLCGNDDTGQMSAWYVFTAMGFYPVTHGTATYFIGSPLFQRLQLKHNHGTLTILAPEASRENCYIQSVLLNGKPYSRSWITHSDLFSANAVLEFHMGSQPNPVWGSSATDVPQ